LCARAPQALNNTATPGGLRVAVFLDTKRLVKGEDWQVAAP